MAKGKKFDAAQKHFFKKEAQLKKNIVTTNFNKQAYEQTIKALKDQIMLLESKVITQQDWIDRLLEYTELDIDDIKKACEADQHTLQINEFIRNMFAIVDRT